MADTDSISDSTPNKRRRLNDNNGKGYNSEDDSGEDFTAEDFETATLPLSQGTKRPHQLQYTKEQFHADLNPSSSTARGSSPPRTYVTQPTQTLRATQPTQPLAGKSNVLVDRSSPIAESSPQRPPQPITRAPFAKPSGLLASAMAPPGTAFRRPLGVQSKPAPVAVDSDEEPDPPIHYSSDEETQGLSSNLKPTNFRTGRALESPNRGSDRVVKESPKPGPAAGSIPNGFSDFLSEFGYSSPSRPKPADDLISAYSGVRRPRPPQVAAKQTGPSTASSSNGNAYNTPNDIQDYVLRNKVEAIQATCTQESVQRCVDALNRNKGNVEDAANWLLEDEERDASGEEDELASASPVTKRGVAIAKTSQPSSQPVRPAAKQEVNAPTRTIAEKYGSTQAVRKPSHVSPVKDDVKPRRRLQQGRKTRSPTPTSSPPQKQPQPLRRLERQPIAIPDDSSSEGDIQETSAETTHDRRLLNFFNECRANDLADLCAQSVETVNFVLSKRPFANLDAIRCISNTETTSVQGKRSKARPIGDKIVEICSEVWTGYDAVDELVEECERLAKPIQDALKGWGVSALSTNGELHLMKLDEAHDSGIGTPASSSASDDIATSRNSKTGFLGQPETMNSEATLKDFQLVGLNWMNLLYSKRLSCILADDMGLGKTCQTISFLAHLHELEQHNTSSSTHLVIVPGSTLENWLRELAYFAPALTVMPYYGSQAERPELRQRIIDEKESIDVIVTTYDMAVKPDDNKFLRKYVDPHVCVYDEAHALRNPRSDRYRQLTRIPASFRVLLTGTPLQNNLQELVAILAFIMPTLFQEKSEQLQYIFQHKASTKNTADHAALLSTQRITRARSMMTPFILRRKKAQVLDLPAKHSHVEYCDMSPTQAKYYEELLGEAQQMFADKATGKKSGATRASSNMLMALRNAAIHPLLARRIYDDKKIDKIVTELLKHPEFAGNPRDRTKAYLDGTHAQSFKGGDYGLHRFCSAENRPYLKKFALKKDQWMDSGKVGAFKEIVSDLAAKGDRALVFSQFTTMMDILEAVLETLRIKFMRLDGSTNMQIRQDMIDQFTNDESITVFMLSTKAGGAGINLACANKVIIFDSGFNPQDDIQAENRAHRVGQTREVEVVRLVTRNTIEEQIHALGESKLALDERVAGEGATAAEDKQTEKAGEQMVEQMFLASLKKEEVGEEAHEEAGEDEKHDDKTTGNSLDLKDAFKCGLEGAGLKVSSKQAQF